MTTLTIIFMWAATIAAMFGFLFLISEVGFYVFLHLLGAVDRMVQDRHFRKLHMQRMQDEKGNDWYVGYGE